MQCYWPIAEPLVGIAKVDTTKLNQWQRLSWRNVRANWNDNQTAQFRFDFEGMASNTIAYIDDAMLIDLTAAFGAGNEPTKLWCDTNIEYFAGNTTIQYEAPTVYDLTSTIPKIIKTGDILNCPYSGSVKSITLPKGQYQLECWGAQGGTYSSYKGGPGGYSIGNIILTKKETLFFYTGGAGTTSTAAGFNGGGTGIRNGKGGGGASDIRVGQDSLYARVIVAGGGGGAGVRSTSANPAGCGGGLYGGDGCHNNTTGSYTTGSNRCGGSASQTAGGKPWLTQSTGTGTFGQGGNASGYSCGGGGGGWYGGGGAYDSDSDFNGCWGGGGSGYVYTSSTASNYPSGCLLNSSYYLTNAQTIAGNTAFTSPTGTNETGHTGNGYIRITVIEASSGNTLVKTTSNNWKEPVQMFVNTGSSTTISSGLVELEYIESTGTQYIDTGIKASKNLKVEADIDVSVVSGWVMILGDYTSGSYFSWWRQNTTMHAYYGSNNKTLAELTGKRKYISNNTNNIWSIDTSKITVTPNSSDFSKDGNNLYLFSVNNGSNYNKASMKLYSCKIYDNGTLVRDFIPAKRISDSKCGLWDKVNFKFYTDENGGNFTAGTEKTAIATVGTSIESLTSNGTQYIDSGFKPNQNTRVICKVSNWPLTNKSTILFGCRTSNSSSDRYAFICTESPNQYRTDFYNNDQTWAAIPSITNTPVIIDKNKNITTIGKNTITNTNGTFQSAYNIYIFAMNQKGAVSGLSSSTIHYLQIYDGNTLVRDFIPIKTTTNIYGLWDKVNKVFYPNAGTGAFTGGPAVTLTGWRKIKGVWAKTAADTWSQTL